MIIYIIYLIIFPFGGTMKKSYNHAYYMALTCAILGWFSLPLTSEANNSTGQTYEVVVTGDRAIEEAKFEPQKVTIITAKDIEEKQAKTVEDIIFNETGVSRTVDAMGRVGVSIRGAEARHTLILVDGQPVMGEFAKYLGAADEVSRIGTENVERIEIIQGAASGKYGSDAIGGVVNIITKKATDKPQLQFNIEGRKTSHAIKGMQTAPYSNFFLRADSGKVGKAKFSFYGSKRDVMPVVASNDRKIVGQMMARNDMDEFPANSLRYYGVTSNIGIMGTYEFNDNNKIEFRNDSFKENLHKYVKRTNSDMEPMVIFKRKADRNTSNLSYSGNRGKADWTVEANYTKLKENDISLRTDFSTNAYEGKNELNSVDDIDHRQFSVKAATNYAPNDNHLLTLGFGYSKEDGKGSRLKSAPKTYEKTIDPWDYDKALYVEPKFDKKAKQVGDSEKKVSSRVHAYKFSYDEKGIPYWDLDYETVGYDKNDPNSKKPPIDFVTYINNMNSINSWLTPEKFKADKDKFNQLLKEENAGTKSPWSDEKYISEYFEKNPDYGDGGLKFNGKHFLEEYLKRQNKITFGEATIKKYFFTLQDTWTKNYDTTIVPIVRYDHSNLFGGNISASLGVTHNYKGNPNTRLKANIGTGYTEPGMGELYYNWEMYSGNPTGFGTARLGWYWIGNPNLKPEKSLNMDIGFEKEFNRTSIKASLFHNKIKDYLTIYFTGNILDFNPWLNSTSSAGFWKFLYAPDMIYSFKNIGEAEITGGDLEIKQKMSKHWELKLGYTYLNARNKSDATMPSKLLDKPTHKVDIGLNYRDDKRGWMGSIWGNYYIDMLDSNALANKGSYMETSGWGTPNPPINYYFKHGEKQEYQKKTYGIWNFMIQKKFGKDNMAYFAIDNLFNHRDDDRALQEKIYRAGVNLKVTELFDTEKAIDPITGEILTAKSKDLFNNYFDSGKAEGLSFFGDIRIRNNFSLGENKPAARVTPDSIVDKYAKKNQADNEDSSLETVINLGLNIKPNDSTNLSIVGKISSNDQTDTKEHSNDKGIQKGILSKVDLTKNVNKWDLSIGRLEESFGTTGYWFNNYYDGVRTVNTSDKLQVAFGLGSFKNTTGVEDTAYNRIEYKEFLRPPYLEEFLGLKRNPYGGFSGFLPEDENPDESHLVMPKGNDNVAFIKQIYDIAEKYANDYKERTGNELPRYDWYNKVLDKENYPTMEIVKVLKHFQKEILKAYGNNPRLFHTGELKENNFAIRTQSINIPLENMLFKVETATGLKYVATKPDMKYRDPNLYDPNNKEASVNPYYDIPANVSADDKKTVYFSSWMLGSDFVKTLDKKSLSLYLGDTTLFEGESKDDLLKSWWQKNGNSFYTEVEKILQKGLNDPTAKLVSTPDELRKEMIKALFEYPDNSNFAGLSKIGDYNIPYIIYDFVNQSIEALDLVDNKALIPREALAATGYGVKMIGNAVVRDEVPAINKALFIKANYKVKDNLGLTAWYFRSLGDQKLNIMHANKKGNDLYSFDQYANVFAIGAQYKLNEHSAISFDAGMNFTKLGRHLNGETIYEHPEGTNIFGLRGYKEGKTPKFWTIRFDIGATDTNIPGSWNAFIDYKYFEHGSFFGGNGTASLPDRYLDGIKSFTFGAGYVPARNWLIEAFYTVGAEGIGKRDTLFGSESFKLGNLARAQITYKF